MKNNHNQNVDIKLVFDDAGNGTVEVISIYIGVSLVDDLNQLGWNLCECDENQAQTEIGNIEIVGEPEINRFKERVYANLCINFSGENREIIEKMLNEFFDAFPYYIDSIIRGYSSHEETTAFRGILAEWSFAFLANNE